MIEIKMTVYDAIELSMLAQLQQMLEQKRAQDQQRHLAFEQHRADGVSSGTSIAHDAMTVVAELRQVSDATQYPEGVPTNSPDVVPESPSAPAAPVPSDIEVARAITEYSQRAGVPKARELIESFGVKNAMSVPDERRAEFVEKTRTEGL